MASPFFARNQCSGPRLPLPKSFLNPNRRVSPIDTITESRAHSRPKSGSLCHLHATFFAGYKLSKQQSYRWPVFSKTKSRSLSIVGVNGTGRITLPLYASPPMPLAAIQHVSRRSSTRTPSRVTSCSVLNGTSLAILLTVNVSKVKGSSSVSVLFTALTSGSVFLAAASRKISPALSHVPVEDVSR